MSLQISNIKLYAWFVVTGWTLVTVMSFVTGKMQQDESVIQVAVAQAHTHLEKDVAFRKWAGAKGGVYVPVSERTQPSLYLSHIPDRDLVLPS
ncbi:MAG: hypothetical protein KOO60_09420, partial [Gemmatimonadales bacterium]|nr:hypothetical protein [Gemmatimonadales bacterium]